MNAERFNALYEVGTPVFAYPGFRPEDFPSATRLVTRTRSQATVLGGHTDVVWVDGHSACIALSHIDVITEDEYKAAVVEEQGALPMPAGSPAQTVEYGIRFSDSSILREGNPLDRGEQERRLAGYLPECPQARLVQRTVSPWTEADR